VNRRIVLVGAGHAHLHVIRQAPRFSAAGIELVLISPADFLYSGLATAVLSGALPHDTNVVDAQGLARAWGVRHICGTVQTIDREGGRLRLAEGEALTFDALSLNVGSQVADPNDLASSAQVWTVKPLVRLLDLRPHLQAEMSAHDRCPPVVIAGGGQTAFEVAGAVCGLCERAGVTPHVTVVGDPLGGQWAPVQAIHGLIAALQGRGVGFVSDRVIAHRPGLCVLASSGELECAALVLATGLVGPRLVRILGLEIDRNGRLLTSRTLQALEDPRVFAAGDCGVIENDPRPCVGVFGVRAGPVLAGNLLAFMTGDRLAAFRPQRHWLAIMDLGDGTGLALRGRLWWMGRAALYLKRRLDLGFVRRTRRHPRAFR
jgi:NADH dehydrogenase FAD-containing subunit